MHTEQQERGRNGETRATQINERERERERELHRSAWRPQRAEVPLVGPAFSERVTQRCTYCTRLTPPTPCPVFTAVCRPVVCAVRFQRPRGRGEVFHTSQTRAVSTPAVFIPVMFTNITSTFLNSAAETLFDF